MTWESGKTAFPHKTEIILKSLAALKNQYHSVVPFFVNRTFFFSFHLFSFFSLLQKRFLFYIDPRKTVQNALFAAKPVHSHRL